MKQSKLISLNRKTELKKIYEGKDVDVTLIKHICERFFEQHVDQEITKIKDISHRYDQSQENPNKRQREIFTFTCKIETKFSAYDVEGVVYAGEGQAEYNFEPVTVEMDIVKL